MGNSQSSKKKFKKDLEKQLHQVVLYPSPDLELIKTKSRKPIAQPTLQHAKKIELHAQPIQGENESKVNAIDGRKQVLDTNKWPNSVHGVIAFKINNITAWGTGVLIGPHIVLTAGHNLYDYKTKAYADVQTLQFLPGMNGQVVPFGVIGVEQYFVSPNYIKSGKEDYGILILKEPIGEVTGYFGIACLDPEEIKKKRINVTGYPSDKVASKSNTYEMWGMEGTAAHVDKIQGHINYLIDTEAGQSGSGVWYKEGDDYYVCGVHVRGTQFANTATLLTRAMYKQIYTWIQEADFKEFLSGLKDTNELCFEQKKINVECLSLLIKYNLNDLAVLNLAGKEIGDEGALILAQNTSWINLRELDLRDNDISAEGAKALARNTSWPNLSKLNLYSNRINEEGAKALSQNTSWIRLSKLSLCDNDISAEGAKALALNISWINLTKLDLTKNNIGEGVKALARNNSWAGLTELYLSSNNISAEGAKALAQNISWPNLSTLDLSFNNIGEEGAKAIAKNTLWIKLKSLDLWSNHIAAEGARGLAQNTSWRNLSRLNLRSNIIDAEGAKALAQNTSWINLSELILGSTKIGAEGARRLAQNSSWTNLSKLDLSWSNIGAEGAQALAQNTSWSNLSSLSLHGNNIDAEGVNTLKQNKTWKRNIGIGTSNIFVAHKNIFEL